MVHKHFACLGGSVTFFCRLLLSFLFGQPLQANSQVFGCCAHELELRCDESNLLDQFAGGRWLPKFDCFYERVGELGTEEVRSFYFEHVVTQCDQVRDYVFVHVFSGVKEGFDLPSLIVAGVELLVPGASRNYLHVDFEFLKNPR